MKFSFFARSIIFRSSTTTFGTTDRHPVRFQKHRSLRLRCTMFVWFLVRTWLTTSRRYWFTRTLYNRIRSCLAHVFVNVVYVLLFNIGPAAAAPVVLYVHNSANQPPGEISLSPDPAEDPYKISRFPKYILVSAGHLH